MFLLVVALASNAVAPLVDDEMLEKVLPTKERERSQKTMAGR